MDFDYESIRDRILSTLSASASWADILPFSVNRRIIDAVSSGIAEMAQYDDYLTRESKWDLARNTSSLVLNSRFLGYSVARKVGANGDLRVSVSSTFDSTPSKIVVIPKWSIFSNGDDIEFTATSANNILTVDNYIEIDIVQGTPKESTSSAAGDTYETIELDDANIENSNYDLYVNSVLWTEVSDLNNSAAIDKVYTLKNKPNLNGIDIQFGNDIFGKKLIAGDTVLFKYVETLGIEGNVISSGIIDTVVSTIYDIDSDVITIYCTNTANLDGGEDEEALETIRANGIDTFQAGDKVVSKTDYEIKLKESSFVLNAVAWGAYEYNIINNNDPWTFLSSEENIVNVSAYTPAGEQLTTSQKTVLSAIVSPDKPPEDIMRFTDVDFIYMAFNVEAFVSSEEYSLSAIKASIIADLQTEYDLAAKDFFEHIYDTVWKKIISDITGVTYHNSYIEIIQYDTFDSAYVATMTLSLFEIVINTVKVYLYNTTGFGSYELIGIDDGSGGFTAETGYELTGSAIDYETGVVNLTIFSGLSETYSDFSIKVYYQTIDENDDDNLILKEINQIFKIEEITAITASYLTTLGD